MIKSSTEIKKILGDGSFPDEPSISILLNAMPTALEQDIGKTINHFITNANNSIPIFVIGVMGNHIEVMHQTLNVGRSWWIWTFNEGFGWKRVARKQGNWTGVAMTRNGLEKLLTEEGKMALCLATF